MKKNFTRIALAIFAGFIAMNAQAATGWFSDYIKLNVNENGLAGPVGYYWIGTDPSYGTSLVAGLGNVTTLKLDGADMKYWSDTQDRTGGSFFYQVTSADGATTYTAATEVIWTQTALGGNDFQGVSSGLNIDLLANVPASATGTACKLIVWAKSWGSDQGDIWLSNGGANYVATFTKTNVLLTGATGIANAGFTNLKGAFDAVNANASGVNTDNIAVKIFENTTETATAALNPSKGVNTLTTTAGSGYVAPVITLTGGTTTVAGSLTVVITNGSVTSITMSGGTWTAAPTVSIAAPAGGGTTATATASGTSGNQTFTITNGGTNYGPSATFSGGGGTGAAVNVVMTTTATALSGTGPRTATFAGTTLTYTLSCPGSGYTSNPTCTISSAAGGSGGSVTVASLYPGAEYNSLVVYPVATGKSISGTGINLISISGRKNVTIDGRVNRTGTPIVGHTDNLTVANTGAFYLIALNNNSQNDTIKYCTLKGSSTGSQGTIQFGSGSSLANGNGLNMVYKNLITNNGTIPQYSIYSIGNSAFPNAGNKISNNEFKDVIGFYLTSTTIYLLGGVTSPQNDNYTINGNSFYSTNTINSNVNTSRSLISIGASASPYGGAHTITDNCIGGSSANCGGNALTKSGTNCSFIGISVYPSASVTAGGVAATSIQNNTIKNISWTNLYFGSTVTFITLPGGNGAVNIGTVYGNNIGENNSTGSIVVAQNSSNATTVCINIGATGTVDCRNNNIGSITTSNSTGFASTTYGIQKTSSAGNVTISGNVIGSTTVANSINVLASTVGQNVYAIYCQGSGTNVVSNNTIANITNDTPSGTLAGIQLSGGSGSAVTANGNTISSLTLLNSTSGGGINGIYSSNGTNSVNGNFIHSYSCTNSLSNSNLAGITNNASTLTATNNIIRIGDNCIGSVYGLLENSGGLGTSYYHNTVYINGAPASGSSVSAALSSNVSVTTYVRNYKNNILYNGRVNNGATGKNYCLKLSNSTSTTNLNADYNDIYFADGTYGKAGSFNSSDVNTITSGAGVLGGANHDVTLNPAFANAGGTTTDSYMPYSTLITGVNLQSSVPTDYNSLNRSTTPTMGALDFAIWNGSAWNTEPTTNYNAKIDGTFSGAGFSCRNLVLNSGKQLSITSGALAVGKNFTILSDDANGTGTFTNSGSLTVGGATTVQQYITSSQTGVNGRNWYISSPLTAALSSTITGATGNGLVYYDGTTNWPAAGSTMEVMKGYIAKSPAQNTTISFVGGTLNNGNQSVTDLPTGFNLVGNPYPSYVDFAQATKTNVANSIWYRSKSTGSYVFQTYNVPGNIGANDGSAIIPPMQSFWIKTTGATNTFGFTNAMRSHQDQSIAANRLKAPGTKVQKLVRLQLSDPSGSDETVIYFNTAAQNTLDEFDTQKMFNTVVAQPELYSKTGTEQLVINGLNEVADNLEIPLGYNTATAGSFTFKAPEFTNFDSNTKIYLLDKKENIQTELSSVAEYTFNSDVTTANESRFSLLFKVSNVTTATDDQKNVNTKVLVNEANQLVIIAPAKSTYFVYNAAGQLFTAGVTTSDRTCTGTVYQKGVYVVKITENRNELTTRVIIK